MLGICLALLALDNIQIGEIGSRAKVVALCDGNEGVLFALLEGLGEVRPGGGDLRNGRTNKLLPVKSNKKISDNRIASIEISPIFIFGIRTDPAGNCGGPPQWWHHWLFYK